MSKKNKPHLIYLGRAVKGSVLAIFGFIAIAGLMMIGNMQILWGVLLILPLPILLIAGEYLWVDTEEKVFKTAVKILGISFFSNLGTFSAIYGIMIKKVRMSKSMSSRGTTTTFRYFEFDAYLNFQDAEPYYLFSGKDREKIMQKAVPVSQKLNIEIVPPDSWE